MDIALTVFELKSRKGKNDNIILLKKGIKPNIKPIKANEEVWKTQIESKKIKFCQVGSKSPREKRSTRSKEGSTSSSEKNLIFHA